ncbi:MAG: hypothetical protein LBB36_04930 [Fibromonadaceae bacterium]|nr:hypothetical protein [Fibromonadaceae bacterium]
MIHRILGLTGLSTLLRKHANRHRKKQRHAANLVNLLIMLIMVQTILKSSVNGANRA